MPDPRVSVVDRLASALQQGEVLDLIPEEPAELIPADMMASWDDLHDIEADGLRNLFLSRNVEEPDPRGVQLRGARIRGRLDLDFVAMRVPLTLEDCLLDHGMTTDAASIPALTLRRCRLSHSAAPALSAIGLHVATTVSLAGSVFTSDSDDGAVRLAGARIDRQLVCTAASVTNTAGPALTAESIVVGGRVFLNEGFTATGSGHRGAVRLSGAHLGQLVCRGATLTNPSGPALSAAAMRVEDRLFLDDGFTADGHDDEGTIRLVGAHIRDRLVGLGAFDKVTSRSDPKHRWNLDGLTYTRVPELDPMNSDHRDAWLTLLREATPVYAAQPYQQLATAFRAQGHDGDVRAVLMAQRRDQLLRGALTRPSDRWWARLTGTLLGYGYQPWRALLYLTAVLILSIVLAVTLGSLGALGRAPAEGRTAVDGTPPIACTVVEMISTGIDLNTPFLPSMRSDGGDCEIISTTTPGAVLTISRWFLQLAAWALAALFIAGFTGIVRKG